MNPGLQMLVERAGTRPRRKRAPGRVVTPLRERILAAVEPGIGYAELMRRVFPPALYPRAWDYPSGGGPPGCAMAFGRGLRDLGLSRSALGDRIEGAVPRQAGLRLDCGPSLPHPTPGGD